MGKSKTYRYSMFALLYFAQGSVLGYFTALNSVYLLSFDISMSQIGIISGIALTPFVLKIFLGMLSDRVNLFGLGFRVPYIVLGLIIQAACLVIVPFIDAGKMFVLYGILAFLTMSGMALYDTCTDGLALDSTPVAEAGTIQGFMVGGRAMGVVIVSGLVGVLAQLVSWKAAFFSMSLITIIPLLLVISYKEAEKAPNQKFQWSAFSAFTSWPIIALGLTGALYSLIINAANEIVNPFLQQEFNITVMNAGFYTTVWGLGVVLGGLTGGRMTDRLGQKRSVILAAAVSFFSILFLSLTTSAGLAWVLVALFGIAYGYYETVYFALSMQKTNLHIAASMFAILMAVANIGTGIGLPISGILSDSIGFRWTFVVIALLNFLILPLLPGIFRQKDESKKI
jgi:PAT family beta-lactamase induction signal transducer AmpG